MKTGPKVDLSKRYQGKPCKRGHSGVRYRASDTCVECQDASSKASRERKALKAVSAG